MSDYRINVKVRNARILNAIEKTGHRPGQPFATLIGIGYHALLEYINCTRVPFDEDGNLRSCAEKLCIFFNKLPNDLWSAKQRIPLIKNEVEHDIDEVSIDSLLDVQSENTGLLENMIQDEIKKSILKAIDALPPKKAEVIRMRFGIDCKEHTFKEIGEILEVSPEYVRNIEQGVFRSLRHPSSVLKEIARELF